MWPQRAGIDDLDKKGRRPGFRWLTSLRKSSDDSANVRICLSQPEPEKIMSMTPKQKNQCHTIIHTSARVAGAGNLSPIPGTGIAADTFALTGMAVSLAAVFGADISKEAARGMAFSAIKNTMLKQPIKVLAKELSRFVPWLGQTVAPTVSIGLVEAAGWTMAEELARHRRA